MRRLPPHKGVLNYSLRLGLALFKPLSLLRFSCPLGFRQVLSTGLTDALLCGTDGRTGHCSTGLVRRCSPFFFR